LTGGDPFYQPDALRELLPFLQSISDDILVYTGFEFKYLCDNYEDILDCLAVVIDGKYVEEQNHGTMLRGSDNQNIIYLNKKIKSRYDHYLTEEHSQIQNFTTVDGVVSVGIHLPHYKDDLNYWAKKKGLKEEDNG
jgi:anaerobic ribonucleoside-triphosphate reductase activating protein